MDEEFYRRQREMMKEVVGESDVVITTAMVPGKRAPVLVTEDMVEGMKPGSVMYSRNLTNFLNLLFKDGEFHIDVEDDIVRDTLLFREGELVSERIKELIGKGEG